MVDSYVMTYERVRERLRGMLHEITWMKTNPLGTLSSLFIYSTYTLPPLRPPLSSLNTLCTACARVRPTRAACSPLECN